MNEFTPHAPVWMLFVHDISKFLSPAALSATGGVVDVWLFARDSATYICSFQAMAEVHYIGATYKGPVPSSDEEREKIQDLLDECMAATQPVEYFNLAKVTAEGFLLSDESLRITPEMCNSKEEMEEQLEEILESLRCNGGAESAYAYYLKKTNAAPPSTS